MMKIHQILILCLCIQATFGARGIDISALTSASAFNCLRANYSFSIVRGYRSSGAVDTNVVANVQNAWNAGMAHVDVYLFPCYNCGNPGSQVSTLVNYLKSHNVRYGMIWLDIEGKTGSTWSTSQASNRAFFEGMVSQARSLGQTVGVYTSSSQWNPIMGSYSGGSSLPLWYAHYNNQPNFNDFVAFGGWSKPAMKQYAGDVTECGVGLDRNSY
eukprot:TRINITY_DN2061_c0_g1_i1.p1 TRINITY_DN2061_c0_g1~~TRINITY_DN2061_c0_g1_i1.p1  ORF type:complete len:214 (+),score=30.03 TRINITY_DN2061_c0_g1_i1:36-677(+)